MRKTKLTKEEKRQIAAALLPACPNCGLREISTEMENECPYCGAIWHLREHRDLSDGIVKLGLVLEILKEGTPI